MAGANDMGPCVEMLRGWPKGPDGGCIDMKVSNRCPLKDPAVFICAYIESGVESGPEHVVAEFRNARQDRSRAR